MSRKGIAGAVIATLLIAGGLGLGIGYFMPDINLFGDDGTFNPTIDGSFNSADGWQYAEWQFTEYILTDPDSADSFNYFYIHLTPDSLFILVDLVSDITNDTIDEWFSVWIDTNNSQTRFWSDTVWNDTQADSGAEMLCFIPESKTFNESLRVARYGGSTTDNFNATLNSSDVEIEYGFQKTIHSQQSHRIFEVKINRASLKDFNATNFNVGFMGYGTMAHILPDTLYWGAPTFFSAEYHRLGEIVEQSYFRCGTGENIWDLT